MPLPLFLLPLLLPVAPLVDGGFETHPLAPTTSTERGVWSVFIHGESDAGIALVDGAGRDGSRAVRYHKTAEGNQNIHLDQIVDVAPETVYRLTAWVRGDGQLRPLLAVLGLNWRVLQQVAAEPGTEWQPLTVWFSSYDHDAVRIEWFPGATGQLYTGVAGTSYLDDVTLTAVADPPPALAQAFAVARPRHDQLVDPARLRPGPVGSGEGLRPIVCRDGVLLYPDGSEVALWGVNIQTALSWEWHQRLRRGDIPMEAASLKALTEENFTHFPLLGSRIVRAHILPADFTDSEGNLVESLFLDVLDHLVAHCTATSTYLYLTLVNEMQSPPHLPDSFMHQTARERWALDPVFADQMERFITALLTRRNPSSGRRYHEEPALALIELINEPKYLAHGDVAGLPAADPVRTAFEAWLAEQGGVAAPEALYATWRYETVGRFLARMVGAVRGAGARQPVVWNLNWPQFIRGQEDVFQAVADSPVDAVSFCLYPGQHEAKHPYWANPVNLTERNYLPYLRDQYQTYDRLGWLLGERFAGKAKCVYEFEQMYSQGRYHYPAMAAVFRALGAQTAQMWEYTLTPIAAIHSGSHFLNLDCTPGKAASFRVAAEVFAGTPRGQPFALRDDETVGGASWRASAAEGRSWSATPDRVVHAGPLAAADLLVTEFPTEVVGQGPSPWFEPGGSGVYRLVRQANGLSLTIRPDATFVREPWQRVGREPLVVTALDAATPRPVVLRLPVGFGPARVIRPAAGGEPPVAVGEGVLRFEASPGVYLVEPVGGT